MKYWSKLISCYIWEDWWWMMVSVVKGILLSSRITGKLQYLELTSQVEVKLYETLVLPVLPYWIWTLVLNGKSVKEEFCQQRWTVWQIRNEIIWEELLNYWTQIVCEILFKIKELLIKLCQNISGMWLFETQYPLFKVCQVATVIMEMCSWI